MPQKHDSARNMVLGEIQTRTYLEGNYEKHIVILETV